MKLILNELSITNFKGIRELRIQFDPAHTSILAANEAGKTTISDAWHWLLTGKNSTDQKDFNIKNTVDTSLNRADHEVSAAILAGGTEVNLKKVYREKWTKKRGCETAEYVGNETLYFFNEVPVQQYDYEAKLNGLFDGNVLKMITNPLYFNSNTTGWGWRNRREILLAIAGDIPTEEIFAFITTADNRTAVERVIEKLHMVKTTQDYKRMIAEQKKKLRAELEVIPARIDEATRTKPEVLDWADLEKLIAKKQKSIAEIDASIADAVKAAQAQNQAAVDHQNKIAALTERQRSITAEYRLKISEAESSRRMQVAQASSSVKEAETAIGRTEYRLGDLASIRAALEREIAALRERWTKINESEIVFAEHQFECPACKRAFAPGDVEEQKAQLQENFHADKLQKLEAINEQGKGKSEMLRRTIAEQEENCSKLEEQKRALSEARSEYDKACQPEKELPLSDLLEGDAEFMRIAEEIKSLEADTPQSKAADTSDFSASKNKLFAEIDQLRRELSGREQIARADARIAELKYEEQTLAQQLADLERTEFVLDQYERARMDVLEERVNGRFKDVSFRLFDRQVNGGESPTCEAMYKGVPFSDLNTAGRIWAGIRIINTLSEFYGISAPIFLDNRESVTRIPETDAQVISLVVSPEDRKIRVVAGAAELAEA